MVTAADLAHRIAWVPARVSHVVNNFRTVRSLHLLGRRYQVAGSNYGRMINDYRNYPSFFFSKLERRGINQLIGILILFL